MVEKLARSVSALTPDLIHQATAEMLALVYERLPERFWPSEKKWRLVMTAQVARMAGIVESMDRLVDERCQADALVLLRALYENLVNLAWFAIDPENRVVDLMGHAMVKRKAVHNDLPTAVRRPRRALRPRRSASTWAVDARERCNRGNRRGVATYVATAPARPSCHRFAKGENRSAAATS